MSDGESVSESRLPFEIPGNSARMRAASEGAGNTPGSLNRQPWLEGKRPSVTITPNQVPMHLLHEFLVYDPETGGIFWRKSQSRRVKPGAPALATKIGRGYRQGKFAGVRLLAHRVAFAMHHNRWPDGFVDHVNGDTSDNRAINLREATREQNMFNTRKTKSTCGIRGVRLTPYGTFRASIKINRKNVGLGSYANAEDARKAYLIAARYVHGEFVPIDDFDGDLPPIPSTNDERRAAGFEPIADAVRRLLAKAEKREGGE